MAATTLPVPTTRLWLLLTAFPYTLFTLLPDSHSYMVSWPWVAIWQIGLLCPILWLLATIWKGKRFPSLGNGLDIAIAILLLGLLVSNLFAGFPSQARWYSWATVGFIAALYALPAWILTDTPRERRRALLVFQGYVNIAFVFLGLFLWTTQTYLPGLSRVDELKKQGIPASYDLSNLELQNWAPLGHQNYVAGYLVLALPLLVGLAILAGGWRRWPWLTGAGACVLALYTTGSRGGWLGLLGVGVFGLGAMAIGRSISPVKLALAGLATAGLLSSLLLPNERLKTAIVSLLQGNVDAYRQINAAIGWRMGLEHPLTGIGPGNVPITYQHYRPITAGRLSEWIYQLHGTPVQLWAELGIGGVLAPAVFFYLLLRSFRRWGGSIGGEDRVLCLCLFAGLSGYALVSLTDYQIDNIAIAGTGIIYLACLISYLPKKETPPVLPAKVIFFAGVALVVAMSAWLIPVHRAWQLSSQGFDHLRHNRTDAFTRKLDRAGELAPWEPYYPYQSGWNLGNPVLSANDPRALAPAIRYFERANQVSPYLEFGYSNLGWLLLRTDPRSAPAAFLESARLIPAKRGVFDGLARGLLSLGETDLAISALALEGIRDPIYMTGTLWRSPESRPIYRAMLDRMEETYARLLEGDISPRLRDYLYSSRGSLHWWRGDRLKAAADWKKGGNSIGPAYLDLSSGKPVAPEKLPPELDAIARAWAAPGSKVPLLRRSWLQARGEALLPDIERELLASLEISPDLDTWARENAPARPYNRQRSGFGVNGRHIDGPQPFDPLPVFDNLAISTWFRGLFPSPDYFPEFDAALQPFRERLLARVSKKS